jgi:cytochrome bd-type quinol oxidase subunit 1
MGFPVWYNPAMANTQIMAIIAIVHVFISHFAIGMGLYVIAVEHFSLRLKNAVLKEYAKKNASLILLISAILGAITGVGIWFTISLLSPAGTSILIHAFVWFWATEWVFFLIEVVTIFLYYFLWDKIDDKLHLIIGFIYFLAGFFSLVLINGIISFQLTPGKWLSSGNIWDAFFNPTFIPSTIARFGFCVVLAAVYSTLVLSFQKDKNVKKIASRLSGVFILTGFILSFIGSIWWVNVIPAEIKSNFLGGNLVLSNFYKFYIYTGLALFVISFIFLFFIPKYVNIVTSIFLLIIAFSSFAYFEYTRERARKPYIIRDYLYSNGLHPGDIDNINTMGIIEYNKWLSLEKELNKTSSGELSFKLQCSNCHSLFTYNSLENKLKGLTGDDIYYILDGLAYNPLMPPFVGVDNEKRALAEFLAEKLNKGR